MMKKMIAVLAAALMTLAMASCGSGKKPQDTNSADLNGKAYTEQTFEGAVAAGLLGQAVDSAGNLVTVSQQSGQSAVVAVYDAEGKRKSSVNTDVTDSVSMFALGPGDAVYLLAEPEGGLETVHVLDGTGKTVKKIELAGMRVSTQNDRGRNNSGNGASAPAASASAPTATARPNSGGNNGGVDFPGGEGGFSMRSRISAMQVAQDGNVIVSSMGSGILVFDESGSQTRTIGDSGSMASGMVVNEKGQLIVYEMGMRQGQGGASSALKTYDAATGGEVSSLEAAGLSGMQSMFYDKTGKRLLFMTDEDVRVLSADGKTSTVLATFSEFSLLNGARQMMSFAVDGRGTIYLAAYNSDESSGSSSSGGARVGGLFAIGGGDGGGSISITLGGGSANEMIRLGLVDASTIKQRKVITMAALNGSRVLDQAISAFQIANPDYKIELKVYNTQVQGYSRFTTAGGNGGGQGQFDVSSLAQALNTDLMSGKGADIIVLDSLPWYKYVDKGLLIDMDQLMQEKQFDASQYFTNIFDACKIGGKLYGVPMSFSYSVLTGSSAYMPDSQSPTMADFLKKAGALPEGVAPFANQDALRIFYQYMQFSYGDLVDTANHRANFDTPEFIQAMKDFKDLIGENTSADNDQNFQAEQLSGNVAYNIASMSNPMSLTMQRAILGDSLKYTNVPTMSGGGSGSFTASLMIGINAGSKNRDAAWEFVKTMLGADIQGSGRLSGYPVLKSAADAMIADMKTGETLGEGNRRMIMRLGDREIEIKPLTDADFQAITDALPKLDSLQAVDPNVQQVLNEELPTFFSGQKSAEEVAGLIQNRVNTILNE
jgi:multiple sugar transport system substrate-binding protein